jgi:hypothetical protein
MRPFTVSIIALLGFALAVQAQPPGPGGLARPTVSPYLSLLNRGNSSALNYLNIVRPQQQMAQQFNALNQQYRQSLNGIQNSIDTLSQESMSFSPYTGRVAVFNSTAGYFSRHPVTGQGGGGSAGFGSVGMGGGMVGGGRGLGGGIGGGMGAGTMGGMAGRGMPAGGGASRPATGGMGGIRR